MTGRSRSNRCSRRRTSLRQAWSSSWSCSWCSSSAPVETQAVAPRTGNCKKPLGAFRTRVGTRRHRLHHLRRQPPFQHRRPASQHSKPTTSMLQPTASRAKITDERPTNRLSRCFSLKLTPRCWTACSTSLLLRLVCPRLTPPSSTICCEALPWHQPAPAPRCLPRCW